MVKIFVYLQDCAVDGGETACVPGTHRLAGSPREVLARPFRYDTMGEEARAEALPQAAMPVRDPEHSPSFLGLTALVLAEPRPRGAEIRLRSAL